MKRKALMELAGWEKGKPLSKKAGKQNQVLRVWLKTEKRYTLKGCKKKTAVNL